MKIEILREKIQPMISLAEKMTSKNQNFPILSAIFLEANDDVLTIKSTNLDIGCEITIPTKTIKSGSLAIPAGVLNSYLASISNEKTVSLEEVNSNLKISSSKTSSTIKTLPKENFPIIPKNESTEKFKINSKDLVSGFKSVWYSSGVSLMKPELSSVYIWSESQNIIFAATDSFRLAEKIIRLKDFKEIKGILIPFKNVSEIIRVLENSNSDVEVCFDNNQISFKFNGFYVVSRVVNGSFPDYRQIFPKSFSTQVNVLKQDLINSLKISSIFTDKFNQISLSFLPKDKSIEVITKNNDLGESKNTINGSVDGEEVSINFNYKYVSDCFQSIPGESVFIGLNGPGKPVLMRGSADNSFTYVVMPMNR